MTDEVKEQGQQQRLNERQQFADRSNQEQAGSEPQGMEPEEGFAQLNEQRETYIQSMAEAAMETFWGYLGGEVESVTNHQVVLSLLPKKHHMNMIGIVHGGVLSSLLDNAMGVAVMLERPHESTVTSNLNVHFVAPAKEGKLTVTAAIIHAARRSLTAEARIIDAAGQLVTLGTGTFRVV